MATLQTQLSHRKQARKRRRLLRRRRLRLSPRPKPRQQPPELQRRTMPSRRSDHRLACGQSYVYWRCCRARSSFTAKHQRRLLGHQGQPAIIPCGYTLACAGYCTGCEIVGSLQPLTAALGISSDEL